MVFLFKYAASNFNTDRKKAVKRKGESQEMFYFNDDFIRIYFSVETSNSKGKNNDTHLNYVNVFFIIAYIIQYIAFQLASI